VPIFHFITQNVKKTRAQRLRCKTVILCVSSRTSLGEAGLPSLFLTSLRACGGYESSDFWYDLVTLP